MATLKRAHQELFRRTPDECFDSIESLYQKCQSDRDLSQEQGGFTIFSLVDALTRLSQRVQLAGDRTELDAKIGRLLALAV